MSQAPPQAEDQPVPLRLLCFDGGGVRGLASLCLLRSVMSYIGDRKPCEYFDMIAGTSTGGLIAIMLGRLEMSVDDAIAAYSSMMKDIFEKKNRINFNPFNANTIPKYDANILKGKICEVIEQSGEARTARFRSNPPRRCRTFVVAKQTHPSCIVHFTDWECLAEPNNMQNEATIWEVALATTAASTFFKPAKITFNGIPYTFIDGGFGKNNPVEALRDLAREYFPVPSPRTFGEALTVILSIGTGVPPAHNVTGSVAALVEEFIRLAFDTQDTHNSFVRQIKGTPLENKYIRFNPPDLLAQVQLDDYKDQATIIGMVVRYAKEEDTIRLFEKFRQMAEVVSSDAEPESSPSLVDDESIETLNVMYDPLLPSFPWSRLGKSEIWIDRTSENYWQRMTLKSFEVYEGIYERCRKNGGHVHYESFREQIPAGQKAASMLEKVWSRLHRTHGQSATSAHFPKGFILAVAYMLHVESIWPEFKPKDDENKPGGVAHARREQIKRWPAWVHCRCTRLCRTEWNFANDSGLVRKVDENQHCITLRWRDANRMSQKLSPDGGKRYNDLKKEWATTTWSPE